MLAARNNHIDCMEILVQFGANINVTFRDTGETAFQWALHSRRTNVVEALLELGVNTNTQNKYGITPLMHALFWGMEPIFQKLLCKSTDIDVSEIQGRTALHFASMYGRQNMLKSLIEAGANVNAIDYYGLTPLMTAAVFNKVESTELLICYGGAELDLTAGNQIIQCSSPIGISKVVQHCTLQLKGEILQ